MYIQVVICLVVFLGSQLSSLMFVYTENVKEIVIFTLKYMYVVCSPKKIKTKSQPQKQQHSTAPHNTCLRENHQTQSN